MATRTEWAGTATELLAALVEIAGERAAKAKNWPTDGTRLSGKVRRAATFLRAVGVYIHLGDRKNRSRTIHISTIPFSGSVMEENSASPASPEASRGPNQLKSLAKAGDAEGDAGGAKGDAGDAEGAGALPSSVTGKSLKYQRSDAGDAGDAKIPTQSALENKGWRARL